MSKLRILASNARAAVIAISEKWLDATVTNVEIQMDGYSILRKDRDHYGDRVCIYTNNKHAYNTRNDLQLGKNLEPSGLIFCFQNQSLF